MKNMIKDALILFAITLIAGLLLGGVNELTKQPIEQTKIEAKNKAYKEVFQNADRFVDIGVNEEVAGAFATETGYARTSFDEVLEAYATDELVGYVLIVSAKEGYGGDIQFAMGLTLDGNLNGISILSISETPGLGMEAGKVLVPQFANRTFDLADNFDRFEYTKTGATSDREIDAISGATITTKAVLNAVNDGIDYFRECEVNGHGWNAKHYE